MYSICLTNVVFMTRLDYNESGLNKRRTKFMLNIHTIKIKFNKEIRIIFVAKWH